MNYNPVFELVNYFKEYTERYDNDNLAEFSTWLKTKLELKESLNKIPVQSTHAGPQDMGNYTGQRLQTELELARLINRLYKFSRMYHKSSLEHLDIDFPDELNLLLEIKKQGTLTKSELIESNLQETTTGTEMIKRLIRSGYLSESTNKDDKRSKMVKLTDKGTNALQEAFPKLMITSKLLGGNLNMAQKQQLIKLMEQLNEFHSTILEENRNASVEELVRKMLY